MAISGEVAILFLCQMGDKFRHSRTAVSVLERLLERFDQLRGQPKQSTAT